VTRRKRIKPGQLVDVTLALQARDLILERTFIDDEAAGRLRDATPPGSKPVARMTLDDVDDLAGHVAAEAVDHASAPYTAKQGQYLAYIYYYARIHGRPPAESNLQRYFRVTPPSRASDDQDARRARTDRASTRCCPLHTASVDAGAVA
jgi:hypothetical protein